MSSILLPKSGRAFLPDAFLAAHELCFLNHDALAELLRSAEQQGAFETQIEFADEVDKRAFENAADVFDWLETTGRVKERAEFLRLTVFPALLSDFLHFVYEALESSRKAKLNVTYALLRKPIQENLFLLETIACDLNVFADHLVRDPLRLRSQKAGGIAAHTERIKSTISLLNLTDRFDPAYLAKLRYDKDAEDSFDGVCNTAVHLFTEHRAIRTENLNINFIFSGWEAKLTQWGYLYSRLPYILSYAHSLVEYVFGGIRKSDADYLDVVERQLAAATVVWSRTIEQQYRHPALTAFSRSMDEQLKRQCIAAGVRVPTERDLIRMRGDGSLPGESRISARARRLRFSAMAFLGRKLSGKG